MLKLSCLDKNDFVRIISIVRKYMIGFCMLLLVGCSGSSYQDVDDAKVTSTFSAKDQKKLVEDLTVQLLDSGILEEEVGNLRPTLLIDVVKNKTSEHIDTESMTDTIKMKILNARLFKIINRDKLDILVKEQELNQVGLTDSQSATRLGKLWGAQYVLYGNFSSTVNYSGKEKQTYYKFTLVVLNIETGEEIWIGEADVNKVTKKSLF